MSTRTFAIFIFCFIVSANALQCIRENGQSVDWVLSYKLPPSKDSKNDLIKKGVAYVYMTAAEPFWTLSKLGVNEENSLLARHVNVYYKRKDEISYIVYNDILPSPLHGKESKNAGHARGLLLADKDGGFWATGTLSGFPGPEEKFTYPESGKTHGEFFSCISMDLETIDKVGTALSYIEAQIFASKMIPDLKSFLPGLSSIPMGDKSNSAPWYHIEKFKTRAGTSLITFSKSKEFNGDLYKDLVAPNLKNDLLVRGSMMEKGGIPSNCTGAQKVKNIQSVSIKEAGITITNDEDNAKWAISELTTGEGWICIGDMDRNESEKLRGGGAICLLLKDVSNIFKDMVSSIEECN